MLVHIPWAIQGEQPAQCVVIISLNALVFHIYMYLFQYFFPNCTSFLRLFKFQIILQFSLSKDASHYTYISV